MAHKKGVGSSRNGRDSNAQRLGLKKFGGEHVLGGNILARQRGTKWKPGKNVGRGKDDTLFSLIEGFVKFENKGQKGKLGRSFRVDADELAFHAFVFKFDDSVDQRKQSIVFAAPDVFARFPLRAALTRQDIAAENLLAAEFLQA